MTMMTAIDQNDDDDEADNLLVWEQSPQSLLQNVLNQLSVTCDTVA